MEHHLQLLGGATTNSSKKKNNCWTRRLLCLLFLILVASVVGLIFRDQVVNWWQLSGEKNYEGRIKVNQGGIVESEKGVVAADDGRCSEIGASMLRQGGHAVDAAVAAALCLGVVYPMSSGIGGGAFMVVWSSSTAQAQSFDMRETAPLASSENMFQNNPKEKYLGALSMGVPGEIAGLHKAWSMLGRLAWKTLFQPAISLAREGFIVSPYLASHMTTKLELIKNDPGLWEVLAPNGKLLQAGDRCYNVKLAETLETLAEQGPQVFYNGTIGEKLVKDVREAGGILTMEDLNNYKVEVANAMTANVMGYSIHGMPPPSSGTLGLAMVLNILQSYGNLNDVKGNIGLHRLIEAFKHMMAARMNLGDPNFIDVSKTVSEMLSPTTAEEIRQRIFDNTTFPADYYMYRWSQLRDHGTSHFCVVDADRNAVSMTSTVNYPFGAGVLSPSTGIVLNNEMDDFSTPSEITPDKLPPAPANFIKPNKRPLSSMTPLIVTKDNQVVGVLGGAGGMNIIPAVTQVFINQFILGMDPLAAVQNPRVYHKLIPNVVSYENCTVIDGDHIELANESKLFLEERGHQLQPIAVGAITQLVVQSLQKPIEMGRKYGNDNCSNNNNVFHGVLTAVSDPRKDGKPAAM